MHLNLCICQEIPKLETKTRLFLLIHAHEIRKPTNSGRLAVDCLKNSEIQVRGHIDTRADLSSLQDPTRQALVLFPAPEAKVLTKELIAEIGKPITLVVPDGTWGQASRMPKREPALRDLPRVVLPVGKKSEYRLRVEPNEEFGLGTMEAIARAFGILEGVAVEEELMRVFRTMVERTLWTKGKLAAGDVFGGLPVPSSNHSPGFSPVNGRSDQKTDSGPEHRLLVREQSTGQKSGNSTDISY